VTRVGKQYNGGCGGDAEEGFESKEEPFSKLPQDPSPIPGRAKPLKVAAAGSGPRYGHAKT
jgi:hypothetical protein